MQPHMRTTGLPEMAPVAGRLIYLTMGPIADYLFGGAQTAVAVLEQMLRADHNLFSHETAQVGIVDGEVSGLMIGYGAPAMRALGLPTAAKLLRACGMGGFLRFLWRCRPLLTVEEARPDEYFIAHLAVRPEYQGKGLGRALLIAADDKAREQGCRKLSLTVEVDNDRALALYLRTGFCIDQTLQVEALHQKIGYNGMHRMLKRLD
jgi:ribosomal protein S18 acetylase RimI-like enzyme